MLKKTYEQTMCILEALTKPNTQKRKNKEAR